MMDAVGQEKGVVIQLSQVVGTAALPEGVGGGGHAARFPAIICPPRMTLLSTKSVCSVE